MNTAIDRPRIFSHLTRTRFLHIEDSLEHRKLRFFIGSFERGKGSSEVGYAFLDLDDARVLFSDMAWGKPVEFVDYKGAKVADGGAISRVLKFQTTPEKPSGAGAAKTWIQVATGPGQLLNGGAVKPLGKPEIEISIPLTIFEGRKLAHACLAYIHAWDVQKQIAAVGSDPSKTRVITDGNYIPVTPGDLKCT